MDDVASNTQTSRRNRLHAIIQNRCVLTSNDAWLISTTGGDYGWLVDMRHAFLDAEALGLICDLFWDQHGYLLPFQIGGMEIAAIPLVVGLIVSARQRGLSVNGFIVRKERKPSGVGKSIEGRIGPEPVVIVDDILNSAGSVEKVRVVLDEAGHAISRVFVILDYRSAPGDAWKARHGLEVESLFGLEAFGLVDRKPAPARLLDVKTVWTFKSPGANHFHVVPKSAPVLAEGMVLSGSDAGVLWARDTETGTLRWSYQIARPGRKGIWSRPAIVDGRVFFGGYDGNLYCLALDDGRELWRAGCADWIGSSPAASPDDGLIFIGLEHELPGRQGGIAAFNMFTGEKVWEHSVPAYVHASPVFSAKHRAVVAGGNDHSIHLLDAVSGACRWTFQTGGEVKEAAVFDEDRDLVYATGFDGFIRAIDVASGRQAWCVATGDRIYSTPLLHEDRLYVTGMDKSLHVIDLIRHRHTAIDIGSRSVCTPVVFSGRVWFGTNGGAAFAFDPHSDGIVGQAQFSDPLTCRLVQCPTTNLVFAMTYMNQLSAVRLEIGEACS